MGEFVQMNQGSNEEEKPRGTYRFQGEIPKLPVPDLKVTKNLPSPYLSIPLRLQKIPHNNLFLLISSM